MTEHAEHTQEPSPESAPAAPVLFEEFGLPSPLEKAIEALGFTACTPIQAETLPHALSDYDVVGQAQTGTGKTAAFLISIIAHQLEFPKDPLLPPGTPRALIVAPTRELAMQIADDAESLCKFSGLRVLSVVGGMDFERQRRILEDHRVDILVGTPGRLIDFITRGKLNLRQVEQLVLDEADRMLSMGFIPDVRRIVRQTPPKNAAKPCCSARPLAKPSSALPANGPWMRSRWSSSPNRWPRIGWSSAFTWWRRRTSSPCSTT